MLISVKINMSQQVFRQPGAGKRGAYKSLLM